eukprot:5315259-Amphidinium_carterae.1
MDVSWLQSVVESLQVGDRAASPAAQSQCGLMARTARFICGLEPSVRDEREVGSKRSLRIEDLELQNGELKRKLEEKGDHPKKKSRMIKLSAVIDQTDGDEIRTLTPEEATKLYEQYTKVTGGMPLEEQEATCDQLAAVQHRVSQGLPPYADLAIFGPYGARMAKKLNSVGMSLSSDGTWTRSQLAGPATFEDWELAYEVLQTTLMMLNVVTLANCVYYHNHVRRLFRTFGAGTWPLLYQSDVRARKEHMERVRRRLQSQYEMGGAPADFRPEAPWNAVWRATVEDESFWNRQFRDAASMTAPRTMPVSSYIEGDAPVEGRPGQKGMTPPSNRQGVATGPPASVNRNRARGADVRIHNVGSDGLFKTNRKGITLCEEFQHGRCTTVAPNTVMVCGKDGAK